ncbi:hypothetical protein F2Q69_00031251 [Brassica cretica]|uniref:Uncharacterized protein n=1 Tax=Brassica cretica TaxID=69181 RepID=A0A8S9S6N1_BRACR|nr:hypothetical protein F2Q69_00031251 [Brassica cretica]
MEGLILAGILGTGVPSSGDPEAGVLPGVWRNSIPYSELDLRKSISLLLNPLVSLEPICRCRVWSLSVNGTSSISSTTGSSDLCEYHGTMDKTGIRIDFERYNRDKDLKRRSPYIVFLWRALVGCSRLNSSIFGNMEGLILAGILGTGVPSSGDPEAGVLPGVWRNSIPYSELDLRKSISLLLNPLVSLEPICRCRVWSLSVNGTSSISSTTGSSV